MKTAIAAFACALVLAVASAHIAEASEFTDEQIRQILIRDSIASYSGNCPCPYNADRAGRRCGKRSAYSRPGGYAPLCYPQDVTDEMVARYRRQHQ